MPKYADASDSEKDIFNDRPVTLRAILSHDHFDRTNDQTRLIRLAREVVSCTPQIRQERVDRLKKAIAQGSYEIDCNKLTEIICNELDWLQLPD